MNSGQASQIKVRHLRFGAACAAGVTASSRGTGRLGHSLPPPIQRQYGSGWLCLRFAVGGALMCALDVIRMARVRNKEANLLELSQGSNAKR